MAIQKKTKKCLKSKPATGLNFSSKKEPFFDWMNIKNSEILCFGKKIIHVAQISIFNIRKYSIELASREVSIFSKSNFSFSFKPFLLLQGLVVSAFVLLCLFSFANFFVAGPEIAESQIIKDVTVKQVSKIVAGQSVKWTVFVNRNQIKAGQTLVQLPKDAYNVKITTVTSEKAKQILAQKPTDDFSLEQRQQLANAGPSVKKENLLAKLSGFLFASLEEGATQVIETITQPESEVTQTPEATYVDLSAQAVETPAETTTETTTEEPETEITTPGETTVVPTTETETPAETIETPAEVETVETPEVVEETPTTEATTEEPETEITTPEETTIEVTPEATTTTETPTETETPAETVAPSVAPETETTSILETTSPTEQEVAVTSDVATTQEEVVEDVVQITYETPAPETTEQTTDTGKLVTVMSEDEDLNVPLVDVVASTKIPEIFKVGQEDKIKIKWKNNGNLNVTFNAYDTDGNGKLDYVEWTVPHLSEQIFEIIFISKAFELDENQEILSDIYDQVQTKDNTWANLPTSHYVRATFGQILDNTKDITIYAKPTDVGRPVTIEVYPVYVDADGNTTQGSLVTTFDAIDHEDTYKVLLTNLQTPTDVFDLKIIATSDIAIDWIVDPTPTDAYWVGGAGNWTADAATHWATTSGGTPDAGNLPGTTTNVHFDSNSGTGTVTVDANISITSFTHSQTSLTVAIGTYDFTVSGASSVTNGTVTIGASSNTGWTTAGMTIGTSGVVTCTGDAKIYDSGDWNSLNGTFNYGTSTVYLTGDASITAKAAMNITFYKLSCAYPGKTISGTTAYLGMKQLIVNGGIYDTISPVLYLDKNCSTTPLVSNDSSSSIPRTLMYFVTGSGNKDTTFYVGADVSSIYGIALSVAAASTNVTFELNRNVSIGGGGFRIENNAVGTIFSTGSANYSLTTTGSFRTGGYNFTASNVSSSIYFNNSTVSIGTDMVAYDASTVSHSDYLYFGGATINVGGNYSTYYNDGTYTKSWVIDPGNSTVNLTGTGSSGTITSNGSAFYNLTQNGTGGTYTLQDALAVSHTLTISAGTMDTKSGSSYAVTVGSADPVNGNFVQSSTTSKFLANSSTITLNGNGTFTADGTVLSTQYNNATLVLNGTNTLTYNHLSAYYENGFKNLTCGQGGSVTTMANTFSVRTLLTIGSGTLTSSGSDLWVRGTNPFSFDSASHLSISTLILYSSSLAIPTLTNGYDCNIQVDQSTVTQTGNITLNSTKSLSVVYNSLVFATWKTDGYNLTVGGNLTIGAATDSALKKLDATNYTNPDVNAKSTITVGGNWLNYGTGTVPSQFIAANSTVIFNATSTGKTITSGTTNSAFYNVTFNGTGGGWTLQDNLTATTLTSTLGRLTDNGKTVTVNGNISIANTTGLMTSTGTWVQGASGNVSNPKDGNQFYILQISASVISTLTTNIQTKKVVLGDNAVLTGGTTYEIGLMYPSGNDFIDMASTSTITGAYIAIYLNGSSTYTQKSWSTASGVRIVYAAFSTIRMTGNWTVGRLWIHGGCCSGSTEASALTLDTGDGTNNYNLTVNGNLTLGFAVVTYPEAYRGKLVLRSGNHIITGDVDVSGASGYTWGYLDLSASNVNLSVGGNIDLTRATLTPGTSSTITLTGTGASGTITSSGNSFYNFTQTGAGTYTLQDALVVSHTLTISAGTMDTNSASSFAVTVGSADPVNGNFVQSSTTSKFLANSSTITLNGNGTFAADGTVSQAGYNSATLILNGTNTLTYNNIISPQSYGFNNLITGQDGNITTIATSTSFRVLSVVTVGTGTLTGNTLLWVVGSNPFSFDAASTLSVTSLYFYGSNQTIPTLTNGYDCSIVVMNQCIVTQTGNVTLNSNKSLILHANAHVERVITWKTDGYNLTVGGNVQIGYGSDTALKKLDATNYTNPDVNAKSTITVGGNWTNYGTGTVPSQFVAANSTVIFNATATGKTITSGTTNSPFYNVEFNGTGGGWTLQDALIATGNFTSSAGTLAVGVKDLTVTGSSTVTGGTVTISAPTTTGWTTAGMTIGTGGTVTMSGASKIYNSGNWDSSVGTLTMPDTAGCRVTMTGVGTTLKNKVANMSELMIADGASVTLLSGITTLQRIYLNGALSIGSYNLSVLGGLTQGANGSITGSGTVSFITYHLGQVSFANPSALNPGTLNFTSNYYILPAGTYSPTISLIISVEGSGTNTFTWQSGDYTFTSPVIFQHKTGSGTMIINCANNPNLTFEKDVTITETVGTVTWTKGTGTITLTGADANINFLGESVEDITVNSTGIKTLTGDVTTDSLTVSAGTLNTNAKNITTTGNFTIADGGLVTASGLAGSTLTVGGNFSAAGHSGALLTLNPSAAWYLNVTGTANASYVNAAYSDASGGTAITQTNSTDSGHNVNWLFNAAPVFASLSDNSSATNPTNAGGNVNFTATATDAQSNQYYLAICKTDSVTAVNGGAPHCATDQTWCVSGATDSGSQASCSYATSAASAESNNWYAFVCDNYPVSLCSVSSQGSGDNGSPFKVNHVPTFTELSTSPDLAGLGSPITFTSTASDTDTDTTADTVALYVCKSNDFTGSACGSAGEWCHSSASASNPSCSYTVTSSDASGSKNYYGYVVDSHNFGAAENPKTSTFATDIDAPVISNLTPATGSIAVLPSAVSFTLNEVGYCRVSLTNQAYSLMTSDCQGGGTTSITCTVSSSDQQSVIAYITCQDVLGNQNTSANSTRVSYGLPGGSPSGGVSFNPITETVQTVQDVVQQTTQTVVETVQNIPQQIVDAPKVVVETVQTVTTNIANVVTTLLPQQEEQQIAYPPIEESVPAETPLVFRKTEELISTSSLGNFVFAPLPESVQSLVSKFPELESTFSQVGISKMKDLQELTTTSFNLPTLNGILPQLSQGVALSKISEAEKAEVPTGIVFASMAEEKIGLNIKISITAQGEPIQTISTIQNQLVTLSVKPEHEAETVKGYVIFKGKTAPVATTEGLSENLFTAGLSSFATASTMTAETLQTAKTEFVLDTFEYTDLDGDGIYTANIVAPAVDANYEIRTIIDYKNSKLASEELSMIMLVDPEGYIYRKISDSEESRIKGAIVSLYWLNPETEKYEIWPATNYQQDNPQTTDATGKYSFLVPEGYYYLKVEHMLYADVQTEPFEVKQGSGIHTNIELKSKNWLLSIFSPGALLIVVALLVLALAIVVAAILISASLQHKNIEQENLKNNKLKK